MHFLLALVPAFLAAGGAAQSTGKTTRYVTCPVSSSSMRAGSTHRARISTNSPVPFVLLVTTLQTLKRPYGVLTSDFSGTGTAANHRVLGQRRASREGYFISRPLSRPAIGADTH